VSSSLRRKYGEIKREETFRFFENINRNNEVVLKTPGEGLDITDFTKIVQYL
jgi:hypothetical protein